MGIYLVDSVLQTTEDMPGNHTWGSRRLPSIRSSVRYHDLHRQPCALLFWGVWKGFGTSHTGTSESWSGFGQLLLDISCFPVASPHHGLQNAKEHINRSDLRDGRWVALFQNNWIFFVAFLAPPAQFCRSGRARDQGMADGESNGCCSFTLLFWQHNSDSLHFFCCLSLGHTHFSLKVPEQRAHSDFFIFLAGRPLHDFLCMGRPSSHSLRILYIVAEVITDSV